MEELQNSKMFKFISRPHYLFIVFIVIIQLLCVTITNGAIATSKLTGTLKVTSKETTSVPNVPSYNSIGPPTNCPQPCLCEEGDGKKQLRTITCRHTGLKLFPTTSRDEITSSSWRFFESLDLSENELSVIPRTGESNAIIGTSIGVVIPTGDTLGAINLMVALGRNLKTINLRGNRITAIEDNTFLPNPNLSELNIERNRLTSISNRAFNGLTKLTTLILKGNHLNHLSVDAFKNFPLLTTLDLTSNSFTEIPYAITELDTLEKLYVSYNKITTIPHSILQKCPNLKKFEINGNPLKTVHQHAFIHLPMLEELRISEAKEVTTLPDLNGTVALELLRFDRANIDEVPSHLCETCPKLKSLELKSNRLTRIPELQNCSELRMLDLTNNHISFRLEGNEDERNETLILEGFEGLATPFLGLSKLHDLHLSHNNISAIGADTFSEVNNLKVLDLSHNHIKGIHDEAFADLDRLEDLNLGENSFSQFPSKGLKNLAHIKVHNNPSLEEFPSSPRFPKIQSLVLSYAYHCCQFIPETFESSVPEYPDFGNWEETILFPGEGDFDPELWNHNATQLWSDGNKTDLSLWENLAPSDIHGFFGGKMGDASEISATPPPGIHCMPAPGPFLPCNDLFDWWSLRCSVWIVFLLALLGNGCVVIVLVASRAKMDVPRFLVCNLAMADFCMGLYLGFLAIVDASTLGEFRKYAIHWQFSPGCQVAGFFGVLSSELSVFTLAVITLERNYAITHAMHLNKRLSLKHAAYIMCGGWSFAIIMASLPLTGISGYWKYAVCLPFDVDDGLSLGYVVFMMLINGVAFSVLMGCYLKMYCAIRGSQAWNSNDSRIAKRMALLVFTDFICWAPIAFFALLASAGVYLISLEQAKVFTIFVLPLNSCCNPFLYAILTKQFKKDCVMICKTIEESRVTRGIGRCRHSSNFSNRQTPANTNSLNSGSGTHGSHGHSKGTVCSCNSQSKNALLHGNASKLVKYWPFKKIKQLVYGYKESGGVCRSDHMAANNSAYAQQIADIQHKQRKTKRMGSVSSDAFSSSRTDSWRHGGRHCPQGLPHGPGHHYRHRRRNSWTVTRKPSQDSQLSSSRNDSSSINSNSTNTWRMSRSSVSSEMSLGRAGSNKNQVLGEYGADGTKFTALANARARVISKANAELSGSIPPGGKSGGMPLNKPLPLSRLASENASFMSMYGAEMDAAGGKPKLTRQTAIMADGDSTCSGKSVTFKEPAGVGSARRFVAATTELGQCPLHAKNVAPRGQRIYDQLVSQGDEEQEVEEESDMEASDAEDNYGEGIEDDGESDGIPLGTTFRTVAHVRDKSHYGKPQKKRATGGTKKSPSSSSQSGGGRLREIGGAMVGFLPRKLSTISSSKEKDIARSPTEEAYDMEIAIGETTPLRHEEETESKAVSSTKYEFQCETEPVCLPKDTASSLNRTESGDCIDAQNTMPSPSKVTNSEDTENTVIHQASSSQVPKDDNISASRSPVKESEDTGITSIRTETEKAKARFLESDI